MTTLDKKPEVGARYKHFKSTSQQPMEYVVQGFARHTETEEELVIYEAQYGEHREQCWARPLGMWFEEVNRPECGYKGPRFIKIEP